MSLAEWKDVVSIGKDIIVSLAAIAAAGTAIYGINSWRRETQGKAKFDAARAFLLAAYRVRTEMANCRSPLIVAGEFPPEWDPQSESPEDRFKSHSHVYSNRWAPVKDAIISFDAAILDAEVVLGSIVSGPAEQLRSCAREIFVAIDMYLSDIRSGGTELDKEFRKSLRSKISSLSGADELGKEIRDAISSIEKAVEPYVARAG